MRCKDSIGIRLLTVLALAWVLAPVQAARPDSAAIGVQPPVRVVQGQFDSAADQASFQSALAETSGGPATSAKPARNSAKHVETPGELFGVAVALSGDTALVGAAPDSDTVAGSVFVFTRNGTVWTQQAKLIAGAGASGAGFGNSVALSGDTALVGGASNAVYVFLRSGTVWNQQARLTAADGASGDLFGHKVALSGDTVVVGATFDDTPAGVNAGSAYVFIRSGTVWTQQAKLTAADGASDDRFGSAVALSADTVVVGANGDATPAGRNVGSAYAFTRRGALWTQQAKLTASDGEPDDLFGSRVALSGDTVLVGAYVDDTPAGADSGSAYVFIRSGTVWSQQAKLIAGDGAPGDWFGISVALSGDTALVGAFLDSTQAGMAAGSAYVFTRSGTSWSQQAKISAGDGAAEDLFGVSVALSGDTALVGAYVDDTPAGVNAGSAHIFARRGTSWTQQAQFTADSVRHNDAGSWATTGSLITARERHTATRLANGKVLVVGGRGNDLGALDRAELYDPGTASWSLAAPLRRARIFHTATLLPDGRVLVAGGSAGSSPSSSFDVATAELYDPVSGTWSDTGTMGTPRSFHTATLLQDGTILVAGGYSYASSAVLASAEIYDPGRGTWRPTGHLRVGRYGHTMTRLRSGKILVAGGTYEDFLDLPTDSTELYDPVAGTWTTIANLPRAFSHHTATLLPNGTVLVAGGHVNSYAGGPARVDSLDSAQFFDPDTLTWSATATLVAARSLHTATALATGEVLLAGGTKWAGTFPGIAFVHVDATELYEEDRGTWSSAGNLDIARSNHTATLLDDGRVLVAGGANRNSWLDSAELYTPAASLGANYTGAWYDPAQSGQGLFVEQLDDGRMVASWYTFAPDGRQTWLIGVGTLIGNSVTMPMLRPENGRFPPAFVSASVVNTAFGQMTLRFDSCDAGLLTFAFPAPFGSGTMPLRRPELPARITCSAVSVAAAADAELAKRAGVSGDTINVPEAKATGSVAALTGSWAPPNQAGHGFQMEVLSGDRLVATWYVYTPSGEQMWLIGAGAITGQTATLDMVRPAGGRFIPNFNPALITAPSIGSLTVTALSCDSARVDYAFAAPFGSGSIPISRITSVRGVPCGD